VNKKLFLSAVSSEFESYRRLLADDLKRPTLDVAVQEDFGVLDDTTLGKLDTYIRACDGVIHLIGKATGECPKPLAVDALKKNYPDLAERLPALAGLLSQPDPGFSYTQWEAYLALYHQRPIFFYCPSDFSSRGEPPTPCSCPREDRFVHDPEQERAQQRHYRRISDLCRDRGQFLNPERLSSAVLRDLVTILPALEQRIDIPPTKLRHTATKLIGREKELVMLDRAWENKSTHVVIIRGKGGEGKTSLVSTWMAEMAMKDWRGAESVFDWSFYSQGTKDQSSATSEFFLDAALKHFGDPDSAKGHAEDKTARLAKLIGQQRGLLVLDGLEPLQYPPGPMHGALKDKAMAALLLGLAARNDGLCIVTTREKVAELDSHYTRCAIDHELDFLHPIDGARLLHHAGAKRAGNVVIDPEDEELQQASEEVKGHALTLFLVGQFLRLTEDGNIRRRDRMKLAEADKEYSNDATRPYGHAFKAIEAYETWFAAGDAQAQRQLAVLRLLGLFDRPAPADCLKALRSEPAIPGLTDVLSGTTEKDWKISISRLSEIKLVEMNNVGNLECHPLLREYFATRLKQVSPNAFRSGHSRLFDHLCESTEYQPDTLPGLLPLYQAVTHGCLAERHEEARANVYRERIQRGEEAYSTKKLGTAGPDLGAVATFFEEPWHRLSPHLTSSAKGWLLNEAAYSLSALGRLSEAREPLRVSMEGQIEQEVWINAAIAAGSLSSLELTLGILEEAVEHGRLSILYADKSGDEFHRISRRTIVADALHHFGGNESAEGEEARILFEQAEAMQKEYEPEVPLLYSLQGFRYCELMLASLLRETWLRKDDKSVARNDAALQEFRPYLNACSAVALRAATTLEWAAQFSFGLLSVALEHLTLAQLTLCRAILSPESADTSILEREIQAALDGIRDAGHSDQLPRALLTAAHAKHFLGHPEEARRLLDEAERISLRGPMPLYLADIYLHRARLFRDRDELTKAAELIHKHHYGRRFGELADAEEAAKDW